MNLPSDEAIAREIAAHKLPSSYRREVETVHRRVAADILARAVGQRTSHVVAICGSQGSGKSTVAAFLKLILDANDRSTAILSLDDLYLSKRARALLAREIHPLLRTRGVPGTHDVALGGETLTALREAKAASRTRLPRFDKAKDNPKPKSQWDVFQGKPSIVLFEGWCVDAIPQPAKALIKPVNTLEAECDSDGAWRRYVNAQLASPYRELFAPISTLIFLKAPSFDCVYRWRGLQERKLKKPGRQAMDKATLKAFIMHYERLTRWMLKEMPGRTDILLPLAIDQHIASVRQRPTS